MNSTRRKRILFVDDEVRILEGIQRLLRPMRDEWEVLVTTSGQSALAIIASEAIDVVVSDMRMPGMDGAELQHEVMRLHPEVVRIILSGQADRESLIRSMGATHQFLAKPCDLNRLRLAVTKACALRDLLHDEVLQRLVASLEIVPSLPTLYMRIQEELQNPDSSAKAIGDIVAQDLGMTAKLLQIANSAQFGMNRQVNTAVDAVVLIGIDTVRALVLGTHAFSELQGADAAGFGMARLWQRALRVGGLARTMAKDLALPATVVDAAFTAGMLQDCGMLLLAANRSAEHAAVRDDPEQPDLAAAERARFSADHGAVGAYLLGLWGLPEPIVEAVAFHHRPAEALLNAINPLIISHAAGALCDEQGSVLGAISLDGSIAKRFNLEPLLGGWRLLLEKTS